MNRPPDIPRAYATVDLAQEADFLLGGLEICPSLRLVRADGIEQTIQPRIMQVLIALRRADGAVVSRDALIESCWDGIVVGDDAINRCIVKLRQAAEFGGGRHFEVETIPRVGYRLKSTPATQTPVVPQIGESLPSIRDGDIAANSVSSRKMPWRLVALGSSAAAILITALFASSGYFRASPQKHWVVVHAELPIATSLISRHPAISPDGTMIAWSAGTDIFSRHIYLKRISGGEPLQLTSDGYDDASPSWSPDGSEIAYVAARQGEPCRLMRVPALAGSAREISRCQSDERSQVIWSPRGKNIFFTDSSVAGGPSVIMQLDLESGRRMQVTHPPKDAYEELLALSPDGRWLSFLRKLSETRGPRILLDLDQRKERVLLPKDSELGTAWSEDSRTLFDVETDGSAYSIWALPIDGGKPQHVFSSPTWMERLSSGPHGLLAAEVSELQTGIARPSTIDGADPRFLETEHGEAFTPDVAPDGSIVAVVSGPTGAALWVFPKESAPRKLPIDAESASDAEPRWSPDASKIAYLYIKDNTMGLRVVTSTGSPLVQIAFPGKAIGAAVWTADNAEVIFPGMDDHGWRLWRAKIRDPRHLIPLAQHGWYYIKGRAEELYGLRGDSSGIWRIDGTPRRIFSTPMARDNHWTVATDSLFYYDRTAHAIIRAPIGRGAHSLLVHVPSYITSSGFAVDPTDHSVVYVARLGNDHGDIELLQLAKQ